MAIVVTDKCQDCRFTKCVTVCPVSCFHGDDRMLYIDPVACILCQACIPVCPENAIFEEAELDDALLKWVAINAERAAALPLVVDQQTPLKSA